MRDHKTVKILLTDLHTHPAVQAWNELGSGLFKPTQIDVIKGELQENNQVTKKYVCRLLGVDEAGSSVIAKCCKRSQAMIENRIYEEILPHIPVGFLKYYGMAEESDGKFCWLFLEYAGDRKYSPDFEDHRQLGTRWLATMHAASIDVESAASLPHKEPKQYLKRLRSARSAILKFSNELPIRSNDLAVLKSIENYFNLLESNWTRVEIICNLVPRTLVHGDFNTKNLRVRNGQNGMEVLPFDWGEAGWGVPAIDYVHVDSATYWSAIHDYWSWLNAEDFQKSIIAGKIFHCIDAIYWQIPSFSPQRLRKPMRNMRIYESWLAAAIQKMEFESS